jgi:hypothetical protein
MKTRLYKAFRIKDNKLYSAWWNDMEFEVEREYHSEKDTYFYGCRTKELVEKHIKEWNTNDEHVIHAIDVENIIVEWDGCVWDSDIRFTTMTIKERV